MAIRQDPIPVTARKLVAVLRHEAACFTFDTETRNCIADIAARQMVSTGKVRIVTNHHRHRRAA